MDTNSVKDSLDTYQKLAIRTAPRNMDFQERVTNALLGLSGETGEIADHFKKAFYQGHELDEGKVIEEIGDTLWYLAYLAHSMDWKLSEIAQINVDKLFLRYGEGFSTEKSINREED